MKRLIFITMAILIAGALLIGGCSGEEPAPTTEPTVAPTSQPTPAPTSEPEPPEKDWPSQIAFSAGGEGSSAYTIAVAVGRVMGKYTDDVSVIAKAVGPPWSSLTAITSCEAYMGWCTSTELYLRMRGLSDKDPGAKSEYNQLFTGPAGYTLAVALEDSGVETIGDLKGKKFALGVSSSVKAVIDAYLHAYGLTMDDMDITTTQSPSDNARFLIEGMADACDMPGSVPVAALTELSTRRDVQIIGLPEDKAEAARQYVLEEYNYPYSKMTVPANSYKGQTEDKLVLGFYHNFGCRPDADEELIYALIKAMFDNQEELNQLLPDGSKIPLETALDDFSAPYHPGAIKYYKEAGVWTAEQDAKQAQIVEELAKY